MSKRKSQRTRHERREAEGEARFAQRNADAALEVVQRVVGDTSQQPRFNVADENKAGGLFYSVWNWVRVAALSDEPRRNANVRDWDAWLRKFVLLEPFLAGVLNSVVQIDKNRGWQLMGAEAQVQRFAQILHDADEGAGWRAYVSWQAQSYYTARAGFISEVGSEGEQGPLRALWSVDPARIELTGNNEFPLKYYPANGKSQDWTAWDYFRASALPSTDETMRGYGYPACARNLDLARIMVAVWEHDKEQLGARAPRGLLLLKGITQDQWDTAMQARTEQLDAYERQYYGGVAVLASSGLEDIGATLFALSQLPKDFDLLTWVNLLMYGYALNFGYDAREFFPVNSGQLGSAKETEVQHRKASSKGDLDFSLAHAEQLQARLPESLQFEYEQRDALGERLDAELAQLKAELITEMANWKINNVSVLSVEQVMQLAAEQGIIPEEWTLAEETAQVTDTEDAELRTLRERALELPRVQRALKWFPEEPIVVYNSRTGRMKPLIDPRAPYPKYWRVERATVNGIASRFKTELRRTIREFCADDSSVTLLVGEMRDLVQNAIPDAFYAGLQQGGIPQSETGQDEAQRADELMYDQLAHVEEFADAVNEACGDKAKMNGALARAELWARSVQAAGEAGVNMALANEMVEFGGEDGDETCATCEKLKGTRHRRKWWEEQGLVPGQPGNENFECGGYRCKHKLIPVRGRAATPPSPPLRYERVPTLNGEGRTINETTIQFSTE